MPWILHMKNGTIRLQVLSVTVLQVELVLLNTYVVFSLNCKLPMSGYIQHYLYLLILKTTELISNQLIYILKM